MSEKKAPSNVASKIRRLIGRSAMLAQLIINSWTAERLAKTESREYTDEKGAKVGTAKVIKVLLPKEALQKITKIEGKARNRHRALTLPWVDRGPRLLTAAVYLKHKAEMEDLQEQHRQAVEEFLDQYLKLRTQASVDMGPLYNEADYPSVEALRRRFALKLKIRPIPQGGDVRFNLHEEFLEGIREDIEEDISESLVTAQEKILERLHRVVNKMAETLGNADKGFHQTLTTNLDEMCDLVPAMNISGDPRITEAVERVREALGGLSTDELKAEPAYRVEVARKARKEAKQLSQLMAGYFGEPQDEDEDEDEEPQLKAA